MEIGGTHRVPVSMVRTDHGLMVVCSDGAVFYRRGDSSEWTPETPIPGTSAAASQRGASERAARFDPSRRAEGPRG